MANQVIQKVKIKGIHQTKNINKRNPTVALETVANIWAKAKIALKNVDNVIKDEKSAAKELRTQMDSIFMPDQGFTADTEEGTVEIGAKKIQRIPNSNQGLIDLISIDAFLEIAKIKITDMNKLVKAGTITQEQMDGLVDETRTGVRGLYLK